MGEKEERGTDDDRRHHCDEDNSGSGGEPTGSGRRPADQPLLLAR